MSPLLAIEKPHLPRPTLREILRDAGPRRSAMGWWP